MLRFARRRLRLGRLLQADAQHFRLLNEAHAIVCFYNSLNQFLDPRSFRAVLNSTYRHLKPRGWFPFDIVLEDGYARSRSGGSRS